MTQEAATALPAAAFSDRASPAIVHSIRAASRRTGVDFAYLMEKAAIESGFDAGARAETSSAAGLYQFIEGTWMDMVRDHGHKYGLGSYAAAIRDGSLGPADRRAVLAHRDNPRIAAAMAAEYARANQTRLESALGRPVEGADLYLAHFLGAGGAEAFLKTLADRPNASAAALLPEAAAANRPVFYDNGRARSVSEVRALFAARIGGGSSVTPSSPRGTSRAAVSPVSPGARAPDVAREIPPPSERTVAARPVFTAPPISAAGTAPAMRPATGAALALEAMLAVAALDPLGRDDSEDARHGPDRTRRHRPVVRPVSRDAESHKTYA